MSSSNKTKPSKDFFHQKFNEYVTDLEEVFPEYTQQIRKAGKASMEERKKAFREHVLPSCSPNRDQAKAPAFVLPGVPMTQEVWDTLSANNKHAIQEYLTLLSFCLLLETESKEDLSGNGWTDSFAKQMMDDMKNKMKSVDFAGLQEKFAKFFGSAAGSNFPQIPEKFLKGQIAKLAEEIVKEFKVEDFGLDPKALEAANNDPSKALEMISEVFMKNPQAFQKTIMKLTKKLQQKVQSGSLRPQDLVAEAEELMKTFSENPQFVEMMETFRQTFGFEGHEDELRSSGNNGSARLSLARQRLRKKYEERMKAQNNGSGSNKK
jgi:hypothetical protein